MSVVGVDPAAAMVLVGRLRVEALRAADLADAIDRASRQAALATTAAVLLDEEASLWHRVAAVIEERVVLATGFTIDLRGASAHLERHRRQGELTADFHRRVLALLDAADSSGTRPPIAALVGSHALALLLDRLSDTELASLLSSLDDTRRTALFVMLHRSPALQRVVDVLPRPPTGPALDSLGALADHFAVVAIAAGLDPRGARLTVDDLRRSLGSDVLRLPAWLRRTVEGMISAPSLFANIASIHDGPLRTTATRNDTIDGERLDLARLHVAAARLLADRATFDDLDAAKTGRRDGFVSEEDIEIAMENGWLSASDATALLAFTSSSSPPGNRQRGRSSGFDRTDSATTNHADGLISYEDVVALAVNLHAYADDPGGALEFVLGLDGTFDDPSGTTSGYSIFNHSDDGVRALAVAALAATDGLLDQVRVVAHLPESPGGERNLLITLYYAELAARMNELMNAELANPWDPTLAGHTGANWMLYAPNASQSIRSALRGDQRVLLLAPTDADRQYLADGNQWIFGDIAPRFAAFIERFPDHGHIDQRWIEEFFVEQRHHNKPGSPMFGPGDNQLRDALLYYAAAIEQRDAEQRQLLTLLGNTLLGTHEQAGAQHPLRHLAHQHLGDDGWRAIVGWLGTAVGLHDHHLASEAMELRLGTEEGRPRFRVGDDLDPPVATTNHLLLDIDLTVDGDPTGRHVFEFPEFDVHARGDRSFDVALPDLGGWDAPPAGTGMDEFPTSTRVWHLDGTDGVLTNPVDPVFEERGDPETLDMGGTGTFDWSEYEDRMWFILNLFRNTAVEPQLFDALGDLGIDRTTDEDDSGDHGDNADGGGHPSRTFAYLPLAVQRQLTATRRQARDRAPRAARQP